MFGILTAEMTRCPGRESRLMAVPTLEPRCIDCLHRTWPASIDLVPMDPPRSNPCEEYVPPWAYGGEE